MSIDPKASALLDSFRVFDGAVHIYQLGCTASLLNVHAQQKRAFNLVWALRHGIDENQFPLNVGVVGGGISALTVSTALNKCGATVRIYERMRGLMHLQQGNSTRFLHPNIALWPNELFGYPITHLPFMNWRSGSAGDVAEQLNHQWEQFKIAAFRSRSTQLQILTNTDVFHVEPKNNKIRVYYNGFEEAVGFVDPAAIHALRLQAMHEIEEVAPKENHTDHDAIIIGSGYGLETPRFTVTPSYWRNDDFAQPILGAKTAKRFLVSGTGDGGLIDTLRLTIRDFHHQKFIQEVMYEPTLRNLGRELQKQLNGASEDKVADIWNRLISGMVIHVGTWPAENVRFEQKLDEFIRDDTLVVLNSRRDCPFLTQSLLLHRILVALLIRKKRIRHVPGVLRSVYRDTEKEEFVALIAQTNDKAIEAHYERIDVVVERHNAIPTLPKMFGPGGSELYESLKSSWDQRGDNDPSIGSPPTGFLADEYKGEHFEISYEIGVCLNGRDPKDILQEFFDGLIIHADNSLPALNGTDFIDIAGFTIRLVDHIFFIPDRHSHLVLPIENFVGTVERAVTCLSISTPSRESLELALDKDFEYHYYKAFVTDDVRRYLIDDGRQEIRPYSWIINNTTQIDAHIEVQSWNSAGTPTGGMYTAHKFLRVPVMLEILGNRWTRTKLDGLGWALCLTRKILHDASRAYELLEWDNHFAWWLPVLKK